MSAEIAANSEELQESPESPASAASIVSPTQSLDRDELVHEEVTFGNTGGRRRPGPGQLMRGEGSMKAHIKALRGQSGRATKAIMDQLFIRKRRLANDSNSESEVSTDRFGYLPLVPIDSSAPELSPQISSVNSELHISSDASANVTSEEAAAHTVDPGRADQDESPEPLPTPQAQSGVRSFRVSLPNSNEGITLEQAFQVGFCNPAGMVERGEQWTGFSMSSLISPRNVQEELPFLPYNSPTVKFGNPMGTDFVDFPELEADGAWDTLPESQFTDDVERGLGKTVESPEQKAHRSQGTPGSDSARSPRPGQQEPPPQAKAHQTDRAFCSGRCVSCLGWVVAVVVGGVALRVGLSSGRQIGKLNAGSPSSKCCHAQTADCFACAAGTTVDDFCSDMQHAQVNGCREKLRHPLDDHAAGHIDKQHHGKRQHRSCCDADTVECLACEAGVSVIDYCNKPGHASVKACNKMRKSCCKENTAQCLACMTGVTVNQYCSRHTFSHLAGCGVHRNKSTENKSQHDGQDQDCCTEPVATCLACAVGQSTGDFCSVDEHSNISGCLDDCMHREDNYEYPGGDLISVDHVQSADQCYGFCRSETKCTSWTWGKKDGGWCHLKRQVRIRRVHRDGFVSGLPGNENTTVQIKDGGLYCLSYNRSLRILACGAVAPREQLWRYQRETGEIQTLDGDCLYSIAIDKIETGPCMESSTRKWVFKSEDRSGDGIIQSLNALCLEAPLHHDKGQLRMQPCSLKLRTQLWGLWSADDLELTMLPTTTTATATVTLTTTDTTTATAEGPSFFCFMLIVGWGYEPGLVRAQISAQKGIFACEKSAVYSNATIDLGGRISVRIVQTHLHCPLAGIWHTAYNTPVFRKLWDKVIEDGDYQKTDWTLKVDADAVFMPDRLRKVLVSDGTGSELGNGMFLLNCHFGLHGPLEVLSRKALDTYASGWKEHCPADLAPQEDAYLQACMLKLSVTQMIQYDILAEPACKIPNWETCLTGQAAFHPFKSWPAYKTCLDLAEGRLTLTSTTTVTTVTTTIPTTSTMTSTSRTSTSRTSTSRTSTSTTSTSSMYMIEG